MTENKIKGLFEKYQKIKKLIFIRAGDTLFDRIFYLYTKGSVNSLIMVKYILTI